MKIFAKRFYWAILDFLFPKICVACEKQIINTESAICFSCLWSLPRYSKHLILNQSLEAKFWGKVSIQSVFAYLQFSKRDKVQKVLHALKYKQQKELGKLFGTLLAKDLNTKLLSDAVLIPIPLHKARLKERGYNQADCVAEGISGVLGYPVMDKVLLRALKTSTQTRSGGRLRRYLNLKTAFYVPAEVPLPYKVILVDDVLTTGATLEAAAIALQQAGVKEIHIVCLAAAL
jgi:ComF family protein